ncbi:MAG: transketolase [Alphaproteobacteria bacterium]|nr:transketolase [Alphaproteobacteria bacterium]
MSVSAEADIETTEDSPVDDTELEVLEQLEKNVLWLSTWMIHNANHLRENTDGVKVGGHQASCASIATLMTALYFKILQPQDRIAVKPHASPVFHAIQYLFGNEKRESLEKFRAFGGAQSYPSRTKDGDLVDFSTGSVGLGAAVTNFASLTQDYLRAKKYGDTNAPKGRMIALVGDAELDEGNIYEALLDTWKHDLRNIWWVIDYNRQSLDGLVNEQLFRIIGRFFRAVGWNVITLKYGRRLYEAFKQPGGMSLKRWFNQCPNDVFSVLTFQSGAAWRQQIKTDCPDDSALHTLIDTYDDDALHRVMTNLGGHCMEAILDAFSNVPNDKPTIFICYTVKGHGLPLQGHKDNHAGLMNPKQMERFREAHEVAPGKEWDLFSTQSVGPQTLARAIDTAPFNDGESRHKHAPQIELPPSMPVSGGSKTSTQESFGRILNDLAKQGGPLAERIVTTSPDVTVSTNLGGWVNQRGLYHRMVRGDAFRERKAASVQKWDRSPNGQHIELGIAENNLFLNLAALGLSHSLFGERLFPIGTLYDPFIARGLDALNYACYQDARFIVVATPSGITLAPEGGAHQSVSTPLIGIGQPGLTAFEPAYRDELAEILLWSFNHLQDEEGGGSVYLRLSTRPLDQPERILDKQTKNALIKGAYWRAPPQKGTKRVIVYSGVLAPEAYAAWKQVKEIDAGVGLLAVTSIDRLYRDWIDSQASDRESHIGNLLSPLDSDVKLVTVLDGHPASLSWLGGVCGHRMHPLGVSQFGQCGNLSDLYAHYGIDTHAILRALQ